MTVIFYILGALLVFLSWKSFRGGWNYLKYFKQELSKPLSDYTPPVTVIAPCRGLDDRLEANFRALLRQDYSHYEVIFVVDDLADPAVNSIRKLSDSSDVTAVKIEIILAPHATESGQKVENLRYGVLHADIASEVFVFVDSDALPPPDLLRSLVAPLEESNVGAATGYRWFISEKPTFSSEMRSVWNASVASALGENPKNNFAWGGATAIRREIFEKLDIREKWRGTISDDFTLTHVVKSAGMEIVFVPRALTATYGSCSFRQLLEFTNRQIKITRVYSPHLWVILFLGTGLFNLVIGWALLLAICSRRNDTGVWAAIAVLFLVAAFSIGKALLRLRAVFLAMPEHAPSIKKQIAAQGFLWFLTPTLFFFNCLAALMSRRIVWRGITYYLPSSHETIVISHRKPD